MTHIQMVKVFSIRGYNMKKYFVQIKYPNEVPLGKSIVKVLLEKAGIDTSEEESDVSKPTIQRYITHLAVATNKGQLNDFLKKMII